MTVATCEFDVASRERLWAYFCEVGAVMVEKYDILPGELVNPGRKGGDISRAREEFVGIWRATVGQRRRIGLRVPPVKEEDEHRARQWEIQLFPLGLPKSWQPLSFPNLGRVLGLDHATLCLAQQRHEKRLRDAATPLKPSAACATGFGSGNGA